ncbi:MAG: hypothetical protein EXS13_04905 [Planctomycetes bacterium]|nr:hypothetical protein [Planctomycetota bacterium]
MPLALSEHRRILRRESRVRGFRAAAILLLTIAGVASPHLVRAQAASTTGATATAPSVAPRGATAAAPSVAPRGATAAAPPGEIIHLLDRVATAKCESILLQSDPLGTVTVDLDAQPPERVHDDGRTRLWRLDLPLVLGLDGRPILPIVTQRGAPLPADIKVEVLPIRSEVLFKDHPDFKDIRRAGDVQGNRYIVFDKDGEITFKVPLPDYPCQLGLSTKVLGTKGDFEATGQAPSYDVLAGGKVLGSFDGTWKLLEQMFDLPSTEGELAITVRMSATTPQKGGMAMLKSFAIVATNGCDRLLVRGPADRDGVDLTGLVAEYRHAAPPPVTRLFDLSLDKSDTKEWMGEVILLTGPVAVVGDSGQEWELLVDGVQVGRARGRGLDEVRFQCTRLGRARLAIRGKGPLRGTFHLLQPRAIFCKLRDPMESLRDPTPFVRGLEATGGHALVRHLMLKDDTRLALLAPTPTRVEMPVELLAGDRFEVEIAVMPLVEEKLRHPPVKGRVTFTKPGGTPLVLAEVECNRKRRVDWEFCTRVITAEQAGSGLLRFESACDGVTPLAAFEALFGFADPVIVRASARRRPNVLVYLIDTLRADHCTSWGYSRDTTPNLARMAAEGIVFERAYSQAPWTRPSVATLFSSYLHSFHNASKTTGLTPEIETLAERFRASGYATGAFLANAHVHGASLNFEQGFSKFEAVEKARERGDSRANQVQESALGWLDQQKDRPFFLYVHTIDPHAPYDPPEATRGVWSGGYDGRITPARTNARELTKRKPLPPADLQHVLDLYDEEILFNDREFGALCDALRERGLWDDTIVLVVSDHGEEFGEHDGFGHGTTLWNELVHVPLVVKLDRREGDPPGGVRVPERVRVMDVPQTLLLRAGIAAPESEFMGFDLAGAFSGGELPELPVIAEEFPDKTMLISGDNKKLIWYGPKCRKPGLWLFDLATDPGERNNLSAERADVCRRMQDQIARIFKDYEDRGFKRHTMVEERLGAADLEALQQLGYTGDGSEEEIEPDAADTERAADNADDEIKPRRKRNTPDGG